MAQEKPNILFITTDQQRFDTCGPRKPSFLRTPHLDLLAHEGITFDRAYADCPICVPSRVQIMSGQYAWRHGMTRNGASSTVLDHENTLPADLARLGYATVAVGKMHFSPQRCRHGFQEMILPDDYYRQMRRSGNPLQPMRHGLGQCELEPTMATVPEALTLTSWTAEQCVDYILHRRDPSRPFFMWCSFSKPHPPFDPPEPYYSMYRQADIPEPVIGDWRDSENCPAAFLRGQQEQHYDLLSPEVIREARAAYYGLITQIDYNLGRVLSALQDRDLLRNTMIVFTSDHGEMLGDHRAGGKGMFHDPSARLPMILRPPRTWDAMKRGETCSALTSLADVRPTLVAAAGGRSGKEVDGCNLVYMAHGNAQPRSCLEGVMGHLEIPNYLAVLDQRWKYIYYPEGAVEQLFDMQEDPFETHDLGQCPKSESQRLTMRNLLEERLARRNSPHLKDGRLPILPLRGDTVAERRASRWPGLHTDELDYDVRH